MRQYVCEKCGEQASSKCPSQRSVFCENMKVSIIDSILSAKVQEVKGNPLLKDLVVTMYVMPEKDLFDGVLGLKRVLNDMSEEEVKIWLCRHEWRIVSGECMFGCHKAQK